MYSNYFHSGTTSPSSDQLKLTKCNAEVISKTTNTLLGWLKIWPIFKDLLRHLSANFLVSRESIIVSNLNEEHQMYLRLSSNPGSENCNNTYDDPKLGDRLY